MRGLASYPSDMVNLTRIYTRLGDHGTTQLVDGSRVPKTDSRVQAYADVDEANAALGVVLALGELPAGVGLADVGPADTGPTGASLADILTRIQNDLFDVGADLATPVVQDPATPPLRITQAGIDRLEAWCDVYNEDLGKLRSFVLPGGAPGAALLHQARTVVRRAERSAWAVVETYGTAVNPLAATYLNRLSDLIFILARVANADRGDVLWQPGGPERADERPRRH